MSDQILKTYANRLGINDSETIKKSMELLRLINLKPSSKTLKENAKILICIECASILCGTDLDHQDAVNLSVLSKNEYNRQKDMIEKLLNLNKKLTLDEICAQLEINDRLKNDARQLLDAYTAKNSYYCDIDSAQAMAIYQSLKLRKVKNTAAKVKLMQLSKLTKTKLWKQLEEQWDNWIEKCTPLTAGAAGGQKSRTGSKCDQKFGNDEAMDTTTDDDANDIPQEQTEQSYEDWRDNMILRAKEMIQAAKKQQQNQMEH